MQGYGLIVVLFAIAGTIGLILFTLATVLGPRAKNQTKAQPFFCGNEPDARFEPRMSVKFYVVALLFIVFDIEAVFLYPWAVSFAEFGWVGFWTMLTFVTILGFGLAYVWKRGALDWD